MKNDVKSCSETILARRKMFSPVKTNGNFKFLIFFSGKLNARIIDISLIQADVHIIIICIIVVGVVLMNNVEIIL